MDDDNQSEPEPPGSFSCPICGRTEFTQGRTTFPIRFIPDGASIWKRIRASMMRIEGMRARKCDYCGNLQLFDS
jgi:hypothetical protein